MKEIFKRHPRYHAAPGHFDSLPDLWERCPRCEELLYARELEQSHYVCSKCKYHFKVSARQRIEAILDRDTFEEFDAHLRSSDPLSFTDGGEAYRDKLTQYASQSSADDAFVYGTGQIDGQGIVFGVTEFKFAGGTMGAAFGEKLARSIDLARNRGLPLVVVSSGGGARMQEGAISLLQMSKSIAALDRMKAAGLPFFSVFADPCLGGITASYAMLGDVNIAEPGAYIGFAGRRVIEQTMRQKLPQDAATAEFLQRHGMVDIIASRSELVSVLSRLIRLYVTCNPEAAKKRAVEQYA